jgi:formylglycine-generating enzyme
MAKIFISYRRQDSAGVAGRIYDRLRGHFGHDAIFMDIDAIPFGVDFRDHIKAALDHCGIMLAVIGHNWAGESSAPRRIDDPRDFVRIEIESALERKLPVVPILIDRVAMPAEADLPPSLGPLAYRNALDLDLGRDFHVHVDRLIKNIERTMRQAKRTAVPPKRPTPRWLWFCLAVLPLAAILGVVIHNVINTGPKRADPPIAGVKGDSNSETMAPRAPAAPVAKAEPPSPKSNGLVTNSIGMTLRLIPVGEFMMGSDATDPDASDDEFVDKAAGKKEKHRVRITKPFYLGIHEVTRGQFRRFVDDSGYRTEAERDGEGGGGWNEETKKFEQNPRYTWQNAGFDQTDEHPVVNVSWNDAVAMAKWLSQKEGKTYRLPTEAEWEYACRARTTTRYSSGDDPEGLAAVGNVADGTLKANIPGWESPTITARDGAVYTAPVGRYNANAWGLFDMHGNVCEWCSDWYAEDYYKRSPVDDPQNTDAASLRMSRGGGWFVEPRDARSALRTRGLPGNRFSLLGFRLAREQSGG